MSKKVIVISTSLRANSNSDTLAKAFAAGAAEAGNEVELISLIGKKLAFCTGCLACQSIGKCVIEDDAALIAEKVLQSEVIVWATPIYYYEMSGQMKVLIDRMNSMYPKDYQFREVYFLSTAAEDEEHTPAKALSGLQGWIDCFDKAGLKGSLFCGGVTMPGDIKGNEKLNAAREMGRKI